MAIESLRALMEASENQDICDVIIHSDCVDRGVTKEASFEKMRALYAAIRRARAGYDPKLRSASGMVGGDGAKMRAYVQQGKTICGDYIGQVIAQALEMGESNACMKCIVAAPTAGSCGVLPAVLLPYQEREKLNDDTMVRAMYVAGAIGQVVASKASIAGAAGGCQAEIGTASAMGAAALCYLGGGDAQAVCHAAAIAIKSMLGLVCDPIAGLVEVPCVKRNAAGRAAGRGDSGHARGRRQNGCFAQGDGRRRRGWHAVRAEDRRKNGDGLKRAFDFKIGILSLAATIFAAGVLFNT